jgi:hypothetical protein
MCGLPLGCVSQDAFPCAVCPWPVFLGVRSAICPWAVFLIVRFRVRSAPGRCFSGCVPVCGLPLGCVSQGAFVCAVCPWAGFLWMRSRVRSTPGLCFSGCVPVCGMPLACVSQGAFPCAVCPWAVFPWVRSREHGATQRGDTRKMSGKMSLASFPLNLTSIFSD